MHNNLGYTVLGQTPFGPKRTSRASTLLLTRKPRLYREESILELEKHAIGPLLVVEADNQTGDYEAMVQRHQDLRFLLPSRPLGTGERINLGMRESTDPFVLVLWDDMRLSAPAFSGRFFDRVLERNLLCTIPAHFDHLHQSSPSLIQPALQGASLHILPPSIGEDGDRTLCAFDFVGIYSREKFAHVGGFDEAIKDSYWQNMDFGLRSWLWGEQLRLATSFRVEYREEQTPFEVSTGDSYRYYWLKNLAPRYNRDSATISASKFLTYARMALDHPITAFNDFFNIRKWVHKNRYRFKTDMPSLVDLWLRD